MIDYKACIFDLDGTVLDSMGVWKKVDEVFLGKRGLPLTDEYVKAVSVMNLDLAAAYTVELYHLKENPKDITKEWLDLAVEEFTYHIQAKAFAVEYIKKLNEMKIPIAVATSSQKELYVPALNRIGVYGLFDVIVDSKMVNCSKESPDVFLKAADCLRTQPKDCLVFEDTVNGIISAKKAGFITVGILDDYQPKFKEDIIKNADFYGEDFREFYEDLGERATVEQLTMKN